MRVERAGSENSLLRAHRPARRAAALAFARGRPSREWACLGAGDDPAPEWGRAFGSGGGGGAPAPPVPMQLPPGERRTLPWEPVVPRDGMRRAGEPSAFLPCFPSLDGFTFFLQPSSRSLPSRRCALTPPPSPHLPRRARSKEWAELLPIPAVSPRRANETCLSPSECGRQLAFLREWGCGNYLAHALPLRSPGDLPPQRPAGAAAEAAAAEAGPPPAEERALMGPYYLFADARVVCLGWAAPRPRPWAVAAHLVAFPRSFALVRCLALPPGKCTLWS